MLVNSFPVTTKERCLTFKYGRNENTIEDANKLCKLLEENKIDYVCYDKESNYYHCEFIVRRCKNKWNDIMKLINSVRSAKYDYITIDFYLTEEKRDYEGNIQQVTYC